MKQLVYDWPIRIFHWCFAGLFLTAFIIGKTVDDDSAIYPYHMIAGLTLAFLVLLRIFWGFIGTKHAKFTDFALHPKDLISYFRGILSGDKRKWAGHNPASSWAALTMMLLGLGAAFSGYNMTAGSENESIREIHEIFANSFLIVAILHIIGIAVHTLRHKELIGLSMVDGKKADVPHRDVIKSSHPALGILLLGLVAAFGIQLVNHYDPETRTLQLFGTTLQLGENEEGEDGTSESGYENHEESNDDGNGNHE